MKVLFIGGTGIISSACTQLAVDKGIDLYHLNRGQSSRPTPEGVTVLRGDIREPESARQALADHTFDAVVDWIAFTPDHIETDIALFAGRTKQFVFISSASAYHTPPLNLPVTESCPLHNPFWQYSRNKIACEERLMRAYREEGFPITIVRPSHTYDRTLMPMGYGYTVIDRMRQGKKVIVHGDGTSLWTLTHHKDFAVGFVGLLGNHHAIGDAFHITNDEILTWNQIFTLLAQAAGVDEPKLVHISSDFIAAFDPGWGDELFGDKAHSMTFDNTKIKRTVAEYNPTIPFHQGAVEIMAYYDGDPARQTVDAKRNAMMDRIIAAYEAALP
ncbi:MAG: SDR family oxidoreductase [Caldilineaceae bacterium]|nr:SDR family oxidoreductase [Caldilineaceae bacterium]MBP8108801.1 SDR family oxidoreductase [Caldilineaceae bacterium]MBP8123949.1 SDR family oxidoreductase [Caldilineaceae bacterium]MBP9073460.1 SDR family oxidoreductase [Caldilineaceae bacterium]